MAPCPMTTSSLWLHDKPLSAAAPMALYQHVLLHAAKIESAPVQQFEVDAQTVYVFQREVAVVPRARGITLGSDRATTCHLFAAHSERVAFLAHLDGAAGQMPALIHVLRDAFADHADAVDLHLVGGFRDSHGESLRLGMELFVALRDAHAIWPGVKFHLRGCAIGANNTITEKSQQVPRIRGIAIRTATMELVPNAWFPDPQPHCWERAALSFAGRVPLASVYDAATATYRVDPAWLMPQPVEVLKYLSTRSKDAELLSLTSSSPQAEHAEYCDEMRAVLRHLLERQAAAEW